MKETKEIIQSSNPKNPNSDNMKGWEIKKLGQVCDFQNGIFRGVQEVAADLQTVPVEEIYGGLLHIFLEKLAAFASGYAPRRGNTG